MQVDVVAEQGQENRREVRIRHLLVSMPCLADVGLSQCSGEMVADRSQPMVLTSMPPKYPHLCSVCQRRSYYIKCYPHLDQEIVEVV
jgi:hypothetical protein